MCCSRDGQPSEDDPSMTQQRPKKLHKSPTRSARHRARELVIQGLYQWQITQEPIVDIELLSLYENAALAPPPDEGLLRDILLGVVKEYTLLTEVLLPHIDRPFTEISLVERAILLASTFEIIKMPQTPYPVIVNEAIELAKTFGGTDGHKFVNGVLDKLVTVERTLY